ncbi:SusE domain-containing protein [Flavobacterium subsaxonicum]|nr:SusE domain-containing protein [Flavobacterium subsaxonicum]
MKTLRNSIIAMLALFAVSCSTDDVEDRPVVAGVDAPVLTAPEEGNAYTLLPDNMDVLAERFIWTPANFGEGIIVSYDIEIDAAGDEFDTPAVIGSTTGATQFAASAGVINNALLATGAAPFVTANFEVRVKAYVGSNVLYSEPVEMIVTPYTTETPRLWMVGGFQAASGYGANFDYATAPQLKAVEYGDTNFEGYVYIAEDITSADNGFKFSTVANENGVNYGMGSTAGTIAEGGANITATAGYYLVKVNTDSGILSYSLTPANWGVVGFATTGSDAGWNNSTDMTYNPTTKVWEITMQLSAGEFKFRANNAWDINYGDTGADGVLESGGDNIVATAGMYKITLDLSNPREYTYTLTAQ